MTDDEFNSPQVQIIPHALIDTDGRDDQAGAQQINHDISPMMIWSFASWRGSASVVPTRRA